MTKKMYKVVVDKHPEMTLFFTKRYEAVDCAAILRRSTARYDSKIISIALDGNYIEKEKTI